MPHQKSPDDDEQLNWWEIYMKYLEDVFGLDFAPEPVSQEELNQLWRKAYTC